MPRWGRAALALQPVRLEQSDRGRTSVDGRRGRPPEVAGAPVHLRHRPRLVLPLRATALVYEVVWLRMLSLVFGHTVYAITTVLAAFMAGLGLGSFLFGRRAARFEDPIRAYGLLEIGIGVSCALTPVLVWLASSVSR